MSVMIGIKDAINLVTNSTIRLKSIDLELIDALNHYLSEDICSDMDMPPFSQSAMDGYAICGNGDRFVVLGEIKAGDTDIFTLADGQAYRIFTGAMIPLGSTAIAKQEIVERSSDEIQLQEKVKQGTSIRLKGEEILSGQIVLKAGVKINPAAIGLLSGLGVSKVKVTKQPIITLVVTGDELMQLGEELKLGKIYESNSYMLKSALLNSGFDSNIVLVKDNYLETKNRIQSAIETSDLVIITGGISVGDYDFVGKVLNEIGVKELFYKVNQKPGKPIFYGEKNNVKIFALPGNPAAALTCFYVYVLLAIKLMMGSPSSGLIKRKVRIAHDHVKKGNRAHLLKAQLHNNEVVVHKGQSSAMLSSFVDANCLVYISSEVTDVKSGEEVEVFMLPI
jgi:molybdopterin molybdotransferase